MYVKMILPSLIEARSAQWRPIKYSLFPPLGLATLAGYLRADDKVVLQDEHVEELDLDDRPDLVVIQLYITSAYRAYEIADHYRKQGSHVCLGGLHVTSLPDEALGHADSIFLGPGEDTWPQFLEDYRQKRPRPIYQSKTRTLDNLPIIRRDLIKRDLYLTPNTIVVSRGCPHACDFCYKESFFKGGRSFYTQKVEDALAEIDRLPGKHLFFLDDNLFADVRFANALFDGMAGMNRIWQAAGTVQAVLNKDLLGKAAACGLRSLFIGFETLNQDNLATHNKSHNLKSSYTNAARTLHDLGVMINGSFIFGMDHDDASVFDRTVDWAVDQSIETATFHILTPYPGTRLYNLLRQENRILHSNWNLYDTRHAVYQPSGMTPAELERGYQEAYQKFYQWSSIIKAAWSHQGFKPFLRHAAYAGGWKKFEPLWSWIIQKKQIRKMIPLLETLLAAGRSSNMQTSPHRDAYLKAHPADDAVRRAEPAHLYRDIPSENDADLDKVRGLDKLAVEVIREISSRKTADLHENLIRGQIQ